MFEERSQIIEGVAVDGIGNDAQVALHALDSAVSPVAAPPVAPDNAGYQLPSHIWAMMVASYAVFFIAIYLATGNSGHARFAIVVSVLYTAMFFGLARIGAKLPGREKASPLDRGAKLSTWTGWMGAGSVHAQVLVVPVVLAIFGIGIATIIGVIV